MLDTAGEHACCWPEVSSAELSLGSGQSTMYVSPASKEAGVPPDLPPSLPGCCHWKSLAPAAGHCPTLFQRQLPSGHQTASPAQ